MKKTIASVFFSLLLFLLVSAAVVPVNAAHMGMSDVQNVVCVEEHFSAVVKQDGSLWAWGEGEDPQWVMDNVRSVSIYSSSLLAVIQNDSSLWLCSASYDRKIGNDNVVRFEKIYHYEKIAENVRSYDYLFNSYLTNDNCLYNYTMYNGEETRHTHYVTSDVVSASVNAFPFSGSGYWIVRSDGSLWESGGWGNYSPSDFHTCLADNVLYAYTGKVNAMIKADHSLWTWGSNQYGTVGNGTYGLAENGTALTVDTPTKILDNVVYMDGGDSLGETFGALLSDGSLWMWGNNHCYQFGKEPGVYIDPSHTSQQTTPVKVMDDVVAFSCGSFHTLAVKSDGSLWGWGLNDRNQLGNGCQGDLIEEYNVYQTVPIKLMDGVMVPGTPNQNVSSVAVN